jgi:hypothetical protein
MTTSRADAIQQLRKFGVFLAAEFQGVKPGDWRAPTIGAEAATSVVEAIAILVLSESERVGDPEPTGQLGTASPGWNAVEPHAHHLRDLARTFRQSKATHRLVGITLGRIEALEAGARALDQLAQPSSNGTLAEDASSRT